MLQYSFFKSKDTILKAWGGLITLLALLYIQVEITVMINEWYGGFYNLLQKANEHEINEFWQEMYKFSVLAFPYIFIATFSSFLAKHYAFWWREKITFDAVALFRNSDKFIEGASQRIQEDAFRFSRLVESIGLQFARAILTLFAFLPLLSTLSENVEIPFLKEIDSSLVYVALFVSVFGLFISWVISIKLPHIEVDLQIHEAEFRKNLVLGEPVSSRLEFTQPDNILSLFTGLKATYKKSFNHYAYLDTWLNFFDQLMVIVPYLLMAPSLFSGTILLGGLVQISNAFSRVQNSFSVFLNNFQNIIELRSIHYRLKEFNKILKK